jgi:hypothetical protein
MNAVSGIYISRTNVAYLVDVVIADDILATNVVLDEKLDCGDVLIAERRRCRRQRHRHKERARGERQMVDVRKKGGSGMNLNFGRAYI